MDFINNFLYDCEIVLSIIKSQEPIIENIVDILSEVRENEGRLFIIGSGGGAGHASHAVNDFRKICNIESYAPYDNVSELTARVNDEGWDSTIVNWLRVSKFNEKDCLFIFSVGGGNIEKNISMNIVNSIIFAREVQARIVGIVGKDGGYTKKMGDAVIVVWNNEYVTPIVEGFQSVIWHLIVSHPRLQINNTKW
jgi:D-sedoheptulose 7-phosphate isomerase